MARWWMTLVAVALTACSGGDDPEQAQMWCAQIQKADPTCMTAEPLSQCVSCHEECGDRCEPIEGSCPRAFHCQE